MDSYDSENDYFLLYMIYQTDEESLEIMLDKYYITSKKMLSYYLYGNEYQWFGKEFLADIHTLILTAIYAYRQDRNSAFSTFYNRLFYYKLLNCRRKHMTYKKRTERNSLSLDKYINDEIQSATYVDIIVNDDAGLEGSYVLDQEERERRLKEIFITLQPMERKILTMYQEGYSYREIADKLHTTPRHVEYILFKARKLKTEI